MKSTIIGPEARISSHVAGVCDIDLHQVHPSAREAAGLRAATQVHSPCAVLPCRSLEQTDGSTMDWNALPDGRWVVTFYFGLTRLAFPSVTEDEWSDFLAQVVTPAFKDGFTVFDGAGQYFNRGRNAIVGIRSKVLVTTGSRADADNIDRIRREYERRFSQIAVGLTVVPAYTDFGPTTSPCNDRQSPPD